MLPSSQPGVEKLIRSTSPSKRFLEGVIHLGFFMALLAFAIIMSNLRQNPVLPTNSTALNETSSSSAAFSSSSAPFSSSSSSDGVSSSSSSGVSSSSSVAVSSSSVPSSSSSVAVSSSSRPSSSSSTGTSSSSSAAYSSSSASHVGPFCNSTSCPASVPPEGFIPECVNLTDSFVCVCPFGSIGDGLTACYADADFLDMLDEMRLDCGSDPDTIVAFNVTDPLTPDPQPTDFSCANCTNGTVGYAPDTIFATLFVASTEVYLGKCVANASLPCPVNHTQVYRWDYQEVRCEECPAGATSPGGYNIVHCTQEGCCQGGHGQCFLGFCDCLPGWQGPTCKCPTDFCEHGTCVDGVCVSCDPGFIMVGNDTCVAIPTECTIVGNNVLLSCQPNLVFLGIDFLVTSVGTFPIANATYNVTIEPSYLEPQPEVTFPQGQLTNGSGIGLIEVNFTHVQAGVFYTFTFHPFENVSCFATVQLTNLSFTQCSIVWGVPQAFRVGGELGNPVVVLLEDPCGFPAGGINYTVQSDTVGLDVEAQVPSNATGYATVLVQSTEVFDDGSFHFINEGLGVGCVVTNQTSYANLCNWCSPNATCNQVSATNFTCTCNQGFVSNGNGSVCLPCLACEFGGTCSGNFTTFESTCDCPANTVGDLCETLLLCTEPICQNGGTCVAEYNLGASFCDCTSTGFTGTFCETAEPVCTTNSTCEPGGYCVNDTEVCACFDPYRGTLCQANGTDALTNCTEPSGLVCSGHGVGIVIATSNKPDLCACLCYNGTAGPRCEFNACDYLNGGCDPLRACTYNVYNNVVCGPCPRGYFLNPFNLACERMNCSASPPILGAFFTTGDPPQDELFTVRVRSTVTGDDVEDVNVAWFLVGAENVPQVALTTDQLTTTDSGGIASVTMTITPDTPQPPTFFYVQSIVDNSTFLNCTTLVALDIT